MNKLIITAELEYDDELMHGNDIEAIRWFYDEILHGDTLILHDNTIGDDIGVIKVLEVIHE